MKIIVVIGGTFEELHAGHVKLLSEAFKIGDKVIIGLTSDEFARKTRGHKVFPYEIRKKRLESLIKSSKWNNKEYSIIKINDAYGPTLKEKDLHVIVVSTETLFNAIKINKHRVKKGLYPLHIKVIDLVETETGNKISSTEIKREVIDAWGRSKSP